MATPKPFSRSPEVPIGVGSNWSLIATSASRQADGMRCAISLFNGTLQDSRTVDVHNPEARAALIEAFSKKAKVEPEWVEKALMELILEIEGVLQEEAFAAGRKSQATRLIDLAEASAALFFRDELGDSYCATTGDGRSVLKIRSQAFRLWLRHLLWQAEQKTPGGQGIEDALGHLEGKALFAGQEIPLEVRVAWHKGDLWYDLGEKAVRLTANGWEVVDEPPVLFRRFKANSAQVLPQRGGDINAVLAFTRANSDHGKLLLLTHLSVAFIPGFPQAALVLTGEHGAAKTSLQQIIKALIDPSAALTLTAPDSLRDFVQQVSHHRVAFYDNLSSLPQWLSDAMCRAITGDGFSKRELYSDDNDILYAFQRVIGLNGINLVVEKPDLLDRSVLINLDRVPDAERREQTEIWRAFAMAKPGILGAIFDILAKAMAIHPTLALKNLPRMADFARWGEAASQAMGYAPGQFLEAYAENVSRQNEIAVEASPVAEAVLAFMEGRAAWEGTPTELFSELTTLAEVLKLNKKSKKWPAEPRWVWRRIQEVRSNLAALGVMAGREGPSGRSRKITLTRKVAGNNVHDVGDVHREQNQSVILDITEKNDVQGSKNDVQGSAMDIILDITEKNDVQDKPSKNMGMDITDNMDIISRIFPNFENDDLANDNMDIISSDCPKYEGEDSDVLEAAEKETEAKRWARRLY